MYTPTLQKAGFINIKLNQKLLYRPNQSSSIGECCELVSNFVLGFYSRQTFIYLFFNRSKSMIIRLISDPSGWKVDATKILFSY